MAFAAVTSSSTAISASFSSPAFEQTKGKFIIILFIFCLLIFLFFFLENGDVHLCLNVEFCSFAAGIISAVGSDSFINGPESLCETLVVVVREGFKCRAKKERLNCGFCCSLTRFRYAYKLFTCTLITYFLFLQLI